MCQKHKLIDPPVYAAWYPQGREQRTARVAVQSGSGVVVQHDDGEQEYLRFGQPGNLSILQ